MLACALFSYGNAKAIVKFLGSLNFDNLSANKGKIYRFQNSSDCDEIFKIILKLSEVDIEDIIINGAKQGHGIAKYSLGCVVVFLSELD